MYWPRSHTAINRGALGVLQECSPGSRWELRLQRPGASLQPELRPNEVRGVGGLTHQPAYVMWGSMMCKA